MSQKHDAVTSEGERFVFRKGWRLRLSQTAITSSGDESLLLIVTVMIAFVNYKFLHGSYDRGISAFLGSLV